MKPGPFDYVCPTELDDALAALKGNLGETAVLASGQSLVPLLALRMGQFDTLVDINRIDSLRGIRVDNGHVVIGAITRQAELADSGLLGERLPVVVEAASYVGHFQIRNRGTVGGSIAFADPAGEWPALALALDAEIEVASTRGRRLVAADDLLNSAYMTTLEPDEIVVAVRLPVPPARSGAAIEEIARRHGDFALVGVVAATTVGDDGNIAKARVALFGVSDRAVRARELEEALVGRPGSDPGLEGLSAQAADRLSPPSDVNGTSDYRRQVARTVIARAVSKALARANGTTED